MRRFWFGWCYFWAGLGPPRDLWRVAGFTIGIVTYGALVGAARAAIAYVWRML